MRGRLHEHRTPRAAHRAALVWVTATGVAGLALGWLRPDETIGALASGAGGPRLPLAVALDHGSVLVGAGCVSWLWWITSLTVLEALAIRQRAAPGCPASVRRVVLAACGVALAAGGTLGQAAAAGPGDPAGAGRTVATVVGLPLPERPVGTTASHHPATLVVEQGASLWSVAAGLLPAGAADHEVNTLWRRIYALNKELIGPDPDLIRPGQRLLLPDAAREEAR